MYIYKVIEIQTEKIVFNSSIYEECIEWINVYVDIINYTIIYI